MLYGLYFPANNKDVDRFVGRKGTEHVPEIGQDSNFTGLKHDFRPSCINLSPPDDIKT
jgi:hypothetical protein